MKGEYRDWELGRTQSDFVEVRCWRRKPGMDVYQPSCWRERSEEECDTSFESLESLALTISLIS